MSSGSEGERYLRALQLVGVVSPTQWSIRPFGVDALRAASTRGPTAGPWAEKFQQRSSSDHWMRAIAPQLGVIVNSTFPYGMNDGPTWAGRGVTTTASAGVEGSIGVVRVVLAPQVFWTQNAGFGLAPPARPGISRYADGIYGEEIDLPQRFGDRPYHRLDLGQSSLAVSALRLTIGGSTADEFWGPAVESPFLLGNNAAGFPHVFIGSDGPLQLGSLRVGIRAIAGSLQQSPYSSAEFANRRRYVTGAIAVAGIRQLPGLEIGLGRLFENIWPDSGLGFADIIAPLFRNPFKAQRARVLKGAADEPDNQIGSLFARWALPASGVEVYGEIGREDSAFDLRDLLLEPDHDMGFMFGLQRGWKQAGDALLVVRAELLNTTQSHLNLVRLQLPPYIHSPIYQGHTQLGQLLGAPTGYAGGGSMVAVDWYDGRGRGTITWRRFLREPPTATIATRDVVQALTVDGLIFGTRIDLSPEITLAYNLNRNGGASSMNLRTALAGTVHW